MVEICCDVIGCDAKMMRGDYEKHQEQAASQHVRLLSAALEKGLKAAHNEINVVKEKNGRLEAEIDSTKQENVALSSAVQKLELVAASHSCFQIKWKIADIAAKKRKGDRSDSPSFDVFFQGGHKLYIQAHIQGNILRLHLLEDVRLSADKDGQMSCNTSRLDVGGTSFTVKKSGLNDRRFILPFRTFLESPKGCGFHSIVENITPYIDNDSIDVVLDLKLNKDNEAIVL